MGIAGGPEKCEYVVKELGFPLTRSQLIGTALITVLREMANPAKAIGKLRRRLSQRREDTKPDAVIDSPDVILTNWVPPRKL